VDHSVANSIGRPSGHKTLGRLLVVSHPCVLAVNQAVYAELTFRGWEITVVVPNRWKHEFTGRWFPPEVDARLQGRLVPLPVLLPGQPQRHIYLAGARRLLKRHRPEIVFVEEESFSLPAIQWCRAAFSAGVPFGVHQDENLDRLLPRLIRATRSWILSRAALVAARSPEAEKLARSWGAAGDVRVIPHAVPAWGRVAPRDGRPFTIGFAGRLVAEKGIEDLMGATRSLSPGFRLLFVGDGPLRDRLAQTSLQGGEIEIVTGVRYEDMPSLYAEMDILVLPSRTTRTWKEQFGRVLVEALWCGVPVIGSDSGAIPWVIETSGGGLVYSEGNVGELAGHLEALRLVANRQELGRAGRDGVERHFGVESVAECMDFALRDALAAG
jgi:glycosyltransferase involved in cell wall biosynthesis